MEETVNQVFQVANCAGVVMTNDPLDPVERGYWMNGTAVDPRFRAALRDRSASAGLAFSGP